MSEDESVNVPIVDLAFVEHVAAQLHAGTSDQIDLSSLVHDRARHADLVTSSVLAWWLLSTELDAAGWTCILPGAGTSALRHLARSGIIAAANTRSVNLVHSDGSSFEITHLHSDPALHQPRLPGVDWAVLDDLSTSDRLRMIPDLADLRRVVPSPVDGRLSYPWLNKLGLASPAITSRGYERFIADASAVLRELIDNVHRWSRSSLAYAVVSATRGGALEGDERESWNRLHIVIADAGIGIPTALREDLSALRAVHSAAEDSVSLEDLDDEGIVYRLLRHAFGERKLPNHNGHGLNVAQIRAAQWVGAFDVVTVDCQSRPFRLGSRGISPENLEKDDHPLALPGVRGTLVHLMLQATDTRNVREEAADAEQLPFEGLDFDDVVRLTYGLEVASL